MASVLRCLKCTEPLVAQKPEPPYDCWACDHPMHTGIGRSDVPGVFPFKGDLRYACTHRKTCNFDFCPACVKINLDLQQNLSVGDYELLSATCAATYRELRANPLGRILLYVDDEVDMDKAELQAIWASCASEGIFVAKLKSTESAMIFLGWFPQLAARPMSSFRVISDMVRKEPADTGAPNLEAGLQLRLLLLMRYDFVGHMLIYSRVWQQASTALRDMPLVSTTGDLSVVKRFATFRSGAHYAEDMALTPEQLLQGEGASLAVAKVDAGVTCVEIRRPQAKDACLAADVFRNVESIFASFSGSGFGRACYLTEAVSVFFSEGVMTNFMNGAAELADRLTGQKRLLGFDEATHGKFFSHLQTAVAQHQGPALDNVTAPVLVWHGTQPRHMKSLVSQGVDMALCGKRGGWHGTGFYGTTFPRYGEEYLKFSNSFDHTGSNLLLLCWVLAGRPHPVTDSSCSDQTAPGSAGCTSNYCLTKDFHANAELLQQPSQCDGDELCTFKAQYVLPRYYVKYRKHHPAVRTSLSAVLKHVLSVVPQLGEGLFIGSEEDFLAAVADSARASAEKYEALAREEEQSAEPRAQVVASQLRSAGQSALFSAKAMAMSSAEVSLRPLPVGPVPSMGGGGGVMPTPASEPVVMGMVQQHRGHATPGGARVNLDSNAGTDFPW